MSFFPLTDIFERFVLSSLSFVLFSSLDDSLLLLAELTDVRDSIRSLEESNNRIDLDVHHQLTESSVHLARQ